MNKWRKNQNNQVEREEFQAYGGAYGYDYTHIRPKVDPAADQSSGRAMPVKPARKRFNASVGFFLLLTIVTVGIVVMLQTVFRLEAVCVIGHEQHTATEVINVSGLKYGQNIFSISEGEVREAVDREASLVFVGMQVKLPNLVYLQVRERKPIAVLEWNAGYYLMDEECVVLEEINKVYEGNLPVVTGVRVQNAYKGLKLSVNSNVQLNVFSALIEELTKQDYASQVREIQLQSPDNVYIINAENVRIRIGRPEDLRRKVQAIRTAMGSLRSINTRAGVLDVSNPKDVKYNADK